MWELNIRATKWTRLFLQLTKSRRMQLVSVNFIEERLASYILRDAGKIPSCHFCIRCCLAGSYGRGGDSALHGQQFSPACGHQFRLIV